MRIEPNLDTIKKIKKDNIATMQIQKITIDHLKVYFNKMINCYSNSVIRKNYGLINAGFRKAVSKGYMIRNPFDNKDEFQVPKSKRQDKKITCFTLLEQQVLIEILDSYNNKTYKNIILLALYYIVV